MEIMQEGLVTVAMDSFQASLWAPEHLAEIERNRPGDLLLRDDVVRKRYIVEVRRVSINDVDHDGNVTGKAVHHWTAEIEHEGEVWRIPGPVLERIISYRDQIISKGRSQAAKEAAEARRVPAVDLAEVD